MWSIIIGLLLAMSCACRAPNDKTWVDRLIPLDIMFLEIAQLKAEKEKLKLENLMLKRIQNAVIINLKRALKEKDDELQTERQKVSKWDQKNHDIPNEKKQVVDKVVSTGPEPFAPAPPGPSITFRTGSGKAIEFDTAHGS